MIIAVKMFCLIKSVVRLIVVAPLKGFLKRESSKTVEVIKNWEESFGLDDQRQLDVLQAGPILVNQF